jgi:hypothetical protein
VYFIPWTSRVICVVFGLWRWLWNAVLGATGMMKPDFPALLDSTASDEDEVLALLGVAAPCDPDLVEDLVALNRVIEGMNKRDLAICERIVWAVIALTKRRGAATADAALRQALSDVARASMI